MIPEFKSFLKKNLIATTMLAFIGWLVFGFVATKYYLNIFPFMLLFFCALSLLVQRSLYGTLKLSIGKFTARFMGITMLKLLVLLVVALIYILLNKQSAIQFIIVFLILYFVYTSVEVYDFMQTNSKVKG